MAAIYTPWSNPGAEYAPKEHSAAVAFEEGYEEAAEANEPEKSEPEETKPDLITEAMSIISEQQQLIKALTAQLTAQSPKMS